MSGGTEGSVEILIKETFDITGMSCSACSARVEKAVAKVVGSENVSVNLLTNSMQVKYDSAKTSAANIIDAVINAGYGAALKNSPAKKICTKKFCSYNRH